MTNKQKWKKYFNKFIDITSKILAIGWIFYIIYLIANR